MVCGWVLGRWGHHDSMLVYLSQNNKYPPLTRMDTNNMTPDKILNVLGMVVIVAGITAATLPGRQTPAIIQQSGYAFRDIIRSAVGN